MNVVAAEAVGDGMVTDDEMEIVNLVAAAWNVMVRIGIADAEAQAHVHAIQHLAMAQLARRTHPEAFR